MEVQHLRIDKHIFEKALQRKLLDETVKVFEVTKECLTEKGTNFLSDLYDVYIKYTTISKKENTKSQHCINVVIKLEPSSEMARNLVSKQDLFHVELRFLRDVSPKIRKLICRQVGPTLFYGSENPGILIMENLINRGFVMKDRQKGLPFEHCCFVMEHLARLHAGSVAVVEKEPELIEFFRNGGIVSRKCIKPFFRLMEVSLLRIGKEIKTWSDEKYVCAGDKIIKLADIIKERCMDVYNYNEEEFCVVNHGDCWINNIMFKENENGQPIDLILVDYQMAVYTSPAVDLLYFLNICPEYEIKYDKDDYLLKVYLNTLGETMKSIGCKRKPPTMEELKQALHKRRIYAVLSGIVLYFRMIANAEDTEDFTEVLGTWSGETKLDVFKNPSAVKLARKMIPVMNQRGYFN